MIKKILVVFGLMLMGATGLRGNLAQAYSVDSSGSGLIPNVLEFKAIPGDQHIALSWVNPKTGDFAGVAITRSEQNYLTIYDSAQSIYKG